MSKEMDFSSIARQIQDGVQSSRLEAENARKREADLAWELNKPIREIEEKRLREFQSICKFEEELFRSSGVVDIFKELRDQGILVWEDSPKYETVKRSTAEMLLMSLWEETVFGKGSDISVTKRVKVSDFTPAYLRISDGQYRYVRELSQNVEFPLNVVKISYNHNSKNFFESCCWITAEVKNNKLLVYGRNKINPYIVGEGLDLVKAIEMSLLDPFEETYEVKYD